MMATREYATLTANPMGEDPATQANAFANAAVGDRISVTLQQSLTKLHQGMSRSRSGVLSTVHLARYVDLTASVAAFRDEHWRGREAYAGVTILLGRSTASVAHVHDARGDRLAVDAQRSLPAGEGYGYQLHAENGDAGITTGVAKLQGKYGRYEVRQESIAGATSTTVSAMGSIVGNPSARPVAKAICWFPICRRITATFWTSRTEISHWRTPCLKWARRWRCRIVVVLLPFSVFRRYSA
jgi:hypothetical protein